jgi:hypothetical protein
LARIGSLTGKIATIDLESASDSISMLMINKLFPPAFVGLLKELRSPCIETPQGLVKLDIVSSMGNGFTFPLQTMIFSCAVRACIRYLGSGSLRAGENWSVFGDDIIVRVEILPAVLSLLDFLGFTVNSTKSFFEGPFRESCGRDFFRGIDVRGVYIRSLNSQQDVYKAINLLNRWSQMHGIPLKRTFMYLRSLIKGKPFLVPRWEADYAGVKVPSRFVTHLKTGSSWRYKRYEVRPSHLSFHVGLVHHPKYGDRPLNAEGLYITYLGGFAEQGKVFVRHGEDSYRARTRRTLNWDYPSPTFVAEVGQLIWPEKPDDYRWQDAIGASNLSGY